MKLATPNEPWWAAFTVSAIYVPGGAWALLAAADAGGWLLVQMGVLR